MLFSIGTGRLARYQRTVRSKTFMLKNQPFVETGKSFGEKPWSILFFVYPSQRIAICFGNGIHIDAWFHYILSDIVIFGNGCPAAISGLGTGDRKKCQRNFQSTMAGYFPMSGIDLYNYYIQLLGEGIRNLIDPNMKN